jgi:hypothetical protein
VPKCDAVHNCRRGNNELGLNENYLLGPNDCQQRHSGAEQRIAYEVGANHERGCENRGHRSRHDFDPRVLEIMPGVECRLSTVRKARIKRGAVECDRQRGAPRPERNNASRRT